MNLYGLIVGNWRSTVGGLLLAAATAWAANAAANPKVLWLSVAIAVFGALCKDVNASHLGLIDGLIAKHGEDAVNEYLQAALQAAKEKSVKTAITMIVLGMLLALAMPAVAQLADNNFPSNIFTAGLSYNSGAAPNVAGTAMYDRLVSGSSTYAFTVLDMFPGSKGAVLTNLSTGVAQKVVTIAGYPIFTLGGVGGSFTGSNAGWNWNTGVQTIIPLKTGSTWMFMPSLRFVSPSVGTPGVVPIVGLQVGWGQ
jgi:hypothetical protein